ncbi:MAG: hypothetical protein ACRD3A_15045 [Terriglobales bacterium]
MAAVTIEVDIDANGKVTVTPNPATAGDGDTVRWHINSNVTGGGSIDVKLPHGNNSPFGNADSDLSAGVEQPTKCNAIEPSTDPLHWPNGVDSYTYQVNFTNSPTRTVYCTLLRAGSQLVEHVKLATIVVEILRQSNLLFVPVPPPPPNPQVGVAGIDGDDCVNFSFTMPKGGGAGAKQYSFKKQGHESWVETIKNSHRTGARVSVHDSGQLLQPGGEHIPDDIHDA